AGISGTRVLGPNRTLSATTGTLTVAAPLDLTGGSITAPTVSVSANMDIGAFSTVNATGTLFLQPGTTVLLRDFAKLSATASVTNNGGTLQLKGPLANVTGLMTNTAGFISGTGRFTAGLNNGVGGTIRVETGDQLVINSSSPTNAGTI